jgi:hypothetical protein
MDLSLLQHVPGYRQLSRLFRRLYYQYRPNPFLWFASPGHFHSPLPDIKLVDRNKATLFDRRMNNIPGIENHVEDQLALIELFSDYYDQLPFKDQKSPGHRFYFQNPFFGYGDAIILYSMMRHFKPHRIIEVGSGFSSAAMLDTNDLFFSKKIAFTFVEPFPERLYSFLSEEDKKQHEIIIDALQNVPLERFAALDAKDILFIDSSHVAKIGSDVVHILTNILPRLNKGVIIHFHDVFWPFEYPEEWIREGRAWNENYILKAFLQFNGKFKVLFFCSYLALHHKRVVEQYLPLFSKMPGGSLWIEKTS